ncbi:MAG TPA: helix-turn-helix domain-containing protein, partial [Trebonia sp.]
MSSRDPAAAGQAAAEPDVWRALASPWRRRLLDRLRTAPATTGELAAGLPQLSRFAVMQHLAVLTEAGLVLPERRGRDRLNHLNPVPLREWYERWVQPLADTGAAELLALKRAAEKGTTQMSEPIEPIRTVRLAYELLINASAERTFEVMTQQMSDWRPYSYGGDRTRRVVLEPRVGGAHYEDWGAAAGHLYGHVTVYDPPARWATRGRLGPGTTLDSEYELTEDGSGAVRVHVIKVAVGPLTEEEAAGIAVHGDFRPYATAIEQLARR